MKFIRLCALLGATLLLQACLPPATTNPVGTTAGLHNDPALTGLWRGRLADRSNGDERDVYFHFLPKLGDTVTVVMVQAGDKPDGDWMVVSATTAAIRGNHFLNATLTHTEDKPDGDITPNSFPMLYRFAGPHRLTLYFMDEDAVKDAIKSGAVRGTVSPGTMGDATITADPKSLDAFMASKRGLALFSKPYATLTKME
ncbi:MAG TPA: hypothetical protein VL971_06485 [Rhizomicrobium sp.]|nr:hypothetical protein [Rhizomicrobium sp.]